MSKHVTLSHTLPDGTVATRTTARTYTHVVIARNDLVKLRAEAAQLTEEDRELFAYYTRCLAQGVGGRDQYGYLLTEARIEEHRRELKGARSAEHFAELRAGARLERLQQKYGDGDAGPWFVHAWSGRLELAEKEARRASGYGWKDVRAEAINGGK